MICGNLRSSKAFRVKPDPEVLPETPTTFICCGAHRIRCWLSEPASSPTPEQLDQSHILLQARLSCSDAAKSGVYFVGPTVRSFGTRQVQVFKHTLRVLVDNMAFTTSDGLSCPKIPRRLPSLRRYERFSLLRPCQSPDAWPR